MVGHTTFWLEGTTILVLYLWNLVCKTIFHQRKSEFKTIQNILQPWRILKIGSNSDEIKKYTSFLFCDLLCWMYSQFCQQKWLKWKNHDFFSILGHFLTKNAFLSTSSDIMPILLECSKILNAYILSHKDMTFSNISC